MSNVPLHDMLFWQHAKDRMRQDGPKPKPQMAKDELGDLDDDDEREDTNPKDGNDGEGEIDWGQKAHQLSAKAHNATASAMGSDDKEDHEKAAYAHAVAASAHTMAGNDKQAKQHLDTMAYHHDCMK